MSLTNLPKGVGLGQSPPTGGHPRKGPGLLQKHPPRSCSPQ